MCATAFSAPHVLGGDAFARRVRYLRQVDASLLDMARTDEMRALLLRFCAPTAAAAATNASLASAEVADTAGAAGGSTATPPSAAGVGSTGRQRVANSLGEERATVGLSNSAEDEDDDTCIVCWEKQAAAAFLPCGHACCCAGCATVEVRRRQRCPLCRAECRKVVVVVDDFRRSRRRAGHQDRRPP